MSERGIKRTLIRTAIDTVKEPDRYYGTEHWQRSIEILCQLGEMYLTDEVVEIAEYSAKNWAEAVANRLFLFQDVPEYLKGRVRELLAALVDPNAPVLPITQTNVKL